MREELDTARQFAVQLAARDKRILEIVGIKSLVENKEKKVDFFLVTGQFHEFNQARVRASPGAPRYRRGIAIETIIKFFKKPDFAVCHSYKALLLILGEYIHQYGK